VLCKPCENCYSHCADEETGAQNREVSARLLPPGHPQPGGGGRSGELCSGFLTCLFPLKINAGIAIKIACKIILNCDKQPGTIDPLV